MFFIGRNKVINYCQMVWQAEKDQIKEWKKKFVVP